MRVKTCTSKAYYTKSLTNLFKQMSMKNDEILSKTAQEFMINNTVKNCKVSYGEFGDMYRQSPVKSPDIKKHYSSNVNVSMYEYRNKS